VQAQNNTAYGKINRLFFRPLPEGKRIAPAHFRRPQETIISHTVKKQKNRLCVFLFLEAAGENSRTVTKNSWTVTL
jgi:hypothetical protein